MTAHEQLIAYLATLVALVIALVGSMLVAAFVPGVLGHIADFGIGTVTGGLIGVLRIPSPRVVAAADSAPQTAKDAAKDVADAAGDVADAIGAGA